MCISLIETSNKNIEKCENQWEARTYTIKRERKNGNQLIENNVFPESQKIQQKELAKEVINIPFTHPYFDDKVVVY